MFIITDADIKKHIETQNRIKMFGPGIFSFSSNPYRLLNDPRSKTATAETTVKAQVEAENIAIDNLRPVGPRS